MAGDPTVSPFWQAAIRSGLIDAEGLGECLKGIAPEKRTPEAFDRRLARQAAVTGRLTPWQAQQLLLGRWKALKIGKYTLLDLIGRGGMGQVYLAQDTRLGRRVAMKVLSRRRSGEPRAVARFEREARIAGQLQDEHLVRIYEDGEAFGLRFLVMEYIDGRDVAQLIEEHGAIPPAVAAEVARQVALGLEYLDRKGLLHRDVTPSNIMVDRCGTARLTDLGLAIDTGDPDILTVEGSTVGTFDYLSPEQACDPHTIDIRSDIYSLGCSLYHMISGSVPFPATTLPEKLAAHRLVEALPLETLVPSCSPELDAVVRRMMSKAPAGRYAHPDQLALDLASFASGPGPLGRLVSAGLGSQGAASATLEMAVVAEWVEFDPGSDASGRPPSAGPVPGLGSQEVFPRIDFEPDLPAMASHPPHVRSDGLRRRARGWFIAATALLLLAAVVALALAFLK